MNISDYTLVVGVDAKHLRQLSWTWPTWRRHKSNLLEVPMVVIYDRDQTTEYEVMEIIDHPHLVTLPWPPEGITYEGDANSKWHNPQRNRMLSGFVHVPARFVTTPYWLKLDTDVVATGDYQWIDARWFKHNPVIVAQGWHYTKPPDQMVLLDNWVHVNDHRLPVLAAHEPLRLRPTPGEDKLRHKRIISWCGFFQTEFTRMCAAYATVTCGEGRLPVPSQDGFMWYCAARQGLGIERVDMKSRGWRWQSGDKNIRRAAEEAMI